MKVQAAERERERERETDELKAINRELEEEKLLLAGVGEEGYIVCKVHGDW